VNRACALILLTVAVCVAPDAAIAADQRPNVLFIAVDDLNHWVTHLGRNPQAQTPNIDRLTQMGTTFSQAYCAVPACEPSRVALMSGRRRGTAQLLKNACCRSVITTLAALPDI
jgi:arylsulfatase A-like enzyme